jgi:hypothetical protein
MRSFELTLMVVIPAALLLCAGAAGTAVLAYRCFRRRLARRDDGTPPPAWPIRATQEPLMTAHDAAHLPVDDAYTAWFGAHTRATQALRAWNAAEPGRRGAAYRAYLAALALEEEAARALERLQAPAAGVSPAAAYSAR